MTALLAADLSRLFFVAAPFTLLVGVAVELFGPPAPVLLPFDPAAISAEQLLWRLIVPSLLAYVAQLAISHLVLRAGSAPREALAAALAAFPMFVAVQLLAGIPVSLGFLALVLPGLYLFARLLFLSAAVAMAEGGSPLAILQRSWAISQDQALPLFLFLLLGLMAMFGIAILTVGAGAALDVVARLAGQPAVGHFLQALAAGIGNCLVAVGTAVAGAVAYRLLLQR